MAVDLRNYKQVVVLSGAGISAASGLPTYRGPDGLWQDDKVARLNRKETFEEAPLEVWNFFGSLRERVGNATPNAAHLALVEMERRCGGTLTVVTQNIDGLHQRAGSSEVHELHGNLLRTRCSSDDCSLPTFQDTSNPSSAPSCPQCSAPLRPDIVLFGVLFGEAIPGGPEHLTKRALRDCDLFIAVGTSGKVSPANRFVRSAKYAGARTVLIDLGSEQAEFDECHSGPAEQLLSHLFLP